MVRIHSLWGGWKTLLEIIHLRNQWHTTSLIRLPSNTWNSVWWSDKIPGGLKWCVVMYTCTPELLIRVQHCVDQLWSWETAEKFLNIKWERLKPHLWAAPIGWQTHWHHNTSQQDFRNITAPFSSLVITVCVCVRARDPSAQRPHWKWNVLTTC